MAALSTALNIARSSLATVSGQTAIASRNISNVGNADYSRKSAVVISLAGGGSAISGYIRAADSPVDKILRIVNSRSSRFWKPQRSAKQSAILSRAIRRGHDAISTACVSSKIRRINPGQKAVQSRRSRPPLNLRPHHPDVRNARCRHSYAVDASHSLPHSNCMTRSARSGSATDLRKALTARQDHEIAVGELAPRSTPQQ